MPIPKAYDASQHEDNIYDLWLKHDYFKPTNNPEAENFSISMPPPNATGQLHLGHACMLALQDIMIRFERMRGKNVLWLPGTDHAGIATQSKVEGLLAKKGITRYDIGREGLIKEIENYVEGSKDTIRKQIRKMGASCDWGREEYTLSDRLSKAVGKIFIDMFNDGLIYRGDRIVNWDPNLQTTVADDEVEYQTETTKFYYFQYGPFVIGTARPETKFGDKVVIVHPDDARYQEYIGKEIELEWINGPIKARVIADESADPEFGSGAMTITPAHSQIDFDLAEKYNLEREQVIDFEGKLLPIAQEFAGMHISEARDKIVEKLDKKGLLVKIDENYEHNLACNYRGGGIIEPQIKKQWFIDVKKPAVNWKGQKLSIKDALLDAVRSDDTIIIPERFNKIYFHWIENFRDWCISRQIWWGHRIPVWYKGDEIKASLDSPGEGWEQDPDTLDTWFSSGLWTFSTLGWPEKTEDLNRFHPTSILETGYDILPFWVCRMLIMSTYALGEVPFKKVYLHGLIRDKQGRKMSKSLGNGIDPLDMIAKYGTDAVRLSLVMGSTPGNDLRLYEEKIAGYRNFVNKLWNSARFLLGICQECEGIDHSKPNDFPIKTVGDAWIVSRLRETVKQVTTSLDNNAYSEAGTKIYEFLWDEYCDWYLEMSKGKDQNPQLLVAVMQNILKLLHPFTPFVTEVLWEKLGTKNHLIIEQWPNYKDIPANKDADEKIGLMREIIYKIRATRTDLKINPVTRLNAVIYADEQNLKNLNEFKHHIQKLARIEELTISEKSDPIEDAAHIVLPGGIEIYIPLTGVIDYDKERERTEKEIKQTQDWVQNSEKKLGNKGFVANAPAEVIEKEQARLEDLKAKLLELEKRLEQLS